MNFRIKSLLFLLTLFFLGCGVKSDPIAPAGTEVANYLNKVKNRNYPQEKKKRKKEERR